MTQKPSVTSGTLLVAMLCCDAPRSCSGPSWTGFTCRLGNPNVIPARLNIDARPVAMRDRSDPLWVVDQEAPGRGAGRHDGLIGVPHAVAELVAPQIVPDILHRV